MDASTIVSRALEIEQETADDFYSSAELYQWLNDALLEFIDESGIYKAKFSITMVADQADYAFPTYMLRPEKVWYDTTMEEMSVADVRKLSAIYPGWRGESAGTPNVYYEEVPNYISVYPKPNASNADKILTVLGVSSHATVSASVVTIYVPAQYHTYLLEYLLYRMKLKDDRQNEANVHYQLFQRGIVKARKDARQANRKDKIYSFFPSKILK